jgi:hypothetical protein
MRALALSTFPRVRGFFFGFVSLLLAKALLVHLESSPRSTRCSCFVRLLGLLQASACDENSLRDVLGLDLPLLSVAASIAAEKFFISGAPNEPMLLAANRTGSASAQRCGSAATGLTPFVVAAGHRILQRPRAAADWRSVRQP